MWFNKYIFIGLFCHSTLSEICINQNPCKCELNSSSTIDLSNVGSLEFPRFQDVYFNNNCTLVELYSYNPCFEIDLHHKYTTTTSGEKACVGAAACVKYPGGSAGELPEVHAIGLQTTAKFDSDGKNYFITYTVPGTQKQLTVYLICSNATYHELSMIEPECSNDKTVLHLSSKCACPNGCQSTIPETSSGLSTGSKLLIAFFTILLSYFFVGIMWNLFNGAKGMELFPNIEFWNELPTLIMEGVIFTCSCFARKSSYGEV